MRDSRIAAPLPNGKGFLFSSVFIVTLVLAGALGGVARAATVGVTLRVSAGEPAATAPVKNCAVQVAAEADGKAVLAAAKASSCLRSYQLTTTSFGDYVSCIDDICETPATTYWRMTENGKLTDYGISDFKANAGDVLGFSYTSWAPCLTPVGC